MYKYTSNTCASTLAILVQIHQQYLYKYTRNTCTNALGILGHIHQQYLYKCSRNTCTNALGLLVQVHQHYLYKHTSYTCTNTLAILILSGNSSLITSWECFVFYKLIRTHEIYLSARGVTPFIQMRVSLSSPLHQTHL